MSHPHQPRLVQPKEMVFTFCNASDHLLASCILDGIDEFGEYVPSKFQPPDVCVHNQVHMDQLVLKMQLHYLFGQTRLRHQ